MRRRFLLLAAGAVVAPGSGQGQSFEPRYITASRTGSTVYRAVLLDADGRPLRAMPLPDRAHGAASHLRRGIACVFARRPGRYLCCLQLTRDAEPQFVAPAGGRHFYGHGVYSNDGRFLFATENDYESARGVIGIYDVSRRYQRIGEFDTYGIGPHDILLIAKLGLLVVANGGIQTHPDSGREKLNLAHMRPSLSVIDTRSGALVARHELPDSLHRLSIRHLALAADGKVWFAGQFEDTCSQPESLAGWIMLSESIAAARFGKIAAPVRTLALPEGLLRRAQGYLSSVAAHGDTVMFTSSRGGFAFLVESSNGRILDAYSMLDCSGVAAEQVPAVVSADRGYVLSSGTGELRFTGDLSRRSSRWSAHQWDNHLYAL